MTGILRYDFGACEVIATQACTVAWHGTPQHLRAASTPPSVVHGSVSFARCRNDQPETRIA